MSQVREVAPHVGAWIETVILLLNGIIRLKSRPVRARGLKRECVLVTIIPELCFPLWFIKNLAAINSLVDKLYYADVRI